MYVVINSNGKVNQIIQTLRLISGSVLVFNLSIKRCDELSLSIQIPVPHNPDVYGKKKVYNFWAAASSWREWTYTCWKSFKKI